MMGRRQKTLTKEQLAEVPTLAAVLTVEQMGDYFGVCERTMFAMMDRDPEILAAYKRGKARAIAGIAGGLLVKARAGDVASACFYLKTQAGWRETTRLEHTGKDGGPIETQEVSPRERIAGQLTRLAATEAAGNDTKRVH